jgi:hypothetical protein
MCLFLVEILLRKMMTGSNRDKQCVPDEYRSALNDIWREYLCYPSDLGDRVARIGEGSTLNIGWASLLHYDYLNDPTHLFDNIFWLSNIVEDFTTHISPSSIAKCASNGVLLQNVPVTFLVYTRSILGFQARKLEDAASVQCNLFQMYLRQITLDYPMDTERLHDEHFRERFLLRVDEERTRLAQHSKHLRQNAYKGHFCAVKETNNRHIVYPTVPSSMFGIVWLLRMNG